MLRTLTLSNPPKHRSLILEYQFETDDIAFVCLYSKRQGRKRVIHDYYVPKQYREYLNEQSLCRFLQNHQLQPYFHACRLSS
jgi:hypothetical protein